MSVFEVQPSTGPKYELPPAGSHAATLVALIDLGTHTEKYGDKEPYRSRKAFLVWELSGEKTTEGKPHFLGKRYTLSINEKSNLGKLIGQWRGKALAKDEGFDVRKLVGKTCLLNVTHETSTKGNDFAAVAGVSPLPKGMKAEKSSVTPFAWSFGDGAAYPAYEWIPYVHGTPLRTVLGEAEEATGTTTVAADSSANGEAAETDEIQF